MYSWADKLTVLTSHCLILQELQYLDDHKGLHERLAGVGYILGPISRDHWFVYVADKVRGHMCIFST